ncbi:hypothetical protein [uncultured Thiodictyon sp.]|jgi:hypothetical protein|uniref:hypothetical protein n=1 Tax=uncultured Thiodictyon sp. TaxID=1846217 RepID=UPI0025E40B5C|nr:hypothetical protein [uncultured Thiodictyon sp.]
MADGRSKRRQRWAEHFVWSKDATCILGLMATGRATVVALNLNNPYIVPARRLWALAGWHPPQGDPFARKLEF